MNVANTSLLTQRCSGHPAPKSACANVPWHTCYIITLDTSCRLKRHFLVWCKNILVFTPVWTWWRRCATPMEASRYCIQDDRGFQQSSSVRFCNMVIDYLLQQYRIHWKEIANSSTLLAIGLHCGVLSKAEGDQFATMLMDRRWKHRYSPPKDCGRVKT